MLIFFLISEKVLVNICNAHLFEEMYLFYYLNLNALIYFNDHTTGFLSHIYKCNMYILSILQAFDPLIIVMGMWDMTEIHIINRIEISIPGELEICVPVLLTHKIVLTLKI